ncbi:MAG: class II aldolase/adducin family protein [Gemmatimonadetes bacterium]|nr:class II aldolase/adducin family protein [Gemmatimonadota bacterium]
MNAAAARRALVAVARRLDERGLVAGAEGNVSVRLDRDRILVTPSQVPKHALRVDDLVIVHLGAPKTRVAKSARGRVATRRATSELALHTEIYAARPDVGAVVHAHPVCATGFAIRRQAIPANALAEVAGVIGPVPVVGYRRPGTTALGTAAAGALSRSQARADVALLANHGAVAVGPSLDVALARMESLEQAAASVVAARILGGVRGLPDREVRWLAQARKRRG